MLDAFGKKKKKNRRREESFEVLSAVLLPLLNAVRRCVIPSVSKYLNDFIPCGRGIRAERVALPLQGQ